MARIAYIVPPIDNPNDMEHRRQLAEGEQQLFDGKINSVGDVTLTINSATSTLTDRRIGANSFINFSPTTANAKAEGTPYVTARADGSCTLNHNNNVQADRTYVYVVLG